MRGENIERLYPDTNGIDYYMSFDDPRFVFKGEEIATALSIMTDNRRIIEFCATYLFRPIVNEDESIEDLLNLLERFDLLKDEEIKRTLIQSGVYKLSNDEYEESIELFISGEKTGFDRIMYMIRYHPSQQNRF